LEESKRTSSLIKAHRYFEWVKKNIRTIKNANLELVNKDIKRWFFEHGYTWTTTPITAIRAASEILHDDADIPENFANSFCKISYQSQIDWIV
jgi:hypothetical protein